MAMKRTAIKGLGITFLLFMLVSYGPHKKLIKKF
jgi:hypothetical protein